MIKKKKGACFHFELPEIPVEEMSASCELIPPSLPQS